MNPVFGLLLLIVACIGNAEWWVVLINRRHSLRYKHHHLLRVRKLHDVGIVGFPVFALWVAFRSDGLLQGGRLQTMPTWAYAIFCFALLGFLPFVWGVLRWNLTGRPRRMSMLSSQKFDLLQAASSENERRQILGESPPTLTRFPLNQIFQLEVNQKRIDLSCNQSANELRIAHFSDLHLIGCPGAGFYEFAFDQLSDMQPDFYVFTGDLIDRDELLPWAIDGFQKLAQVAPVFFILGNHDWHLDYQQIRSSLVRTGAIDLGERHELHSTNDLKILLAGTEAPWIGCNPDVPDSLLCDARILLSHSPDQRNYAIQSGFDLMLCGHNHGGQVVLPGIGPVYSPSKYGVKYAGGCHEASGLLLHISRGIAAKDALRWNCRPEISLLQILIAKKFPVSGSPIG